MPKDTATPKNTRSQASAPQGATSHRSNNWIFGTMLFFGVAGLIAAFVLTVEKFALLKDPDTALSCSFNAVLNCATVMKTPQASVFGFANSLLGVMAYPVVITIAMARLARARFPRAFMAAAQVGYTLGLIFAYWMFFDSLYVIEVLCPWCLTVTLSTTIIVAAMTRSNLRENNLYLPKNAHKRALAFINKDYDKLIVVTWLVLMVALVYLQFGQRLFL